MADARYDVIVQQNLAESGTLFTQKNLTITRGCLLSASKDANREIAVLGAGSLGQVLKVGANSDLEWADEAGGHTQNTDTGTTGSTFDIDSDGTTNGVKLKANTGVLEVRNLADDAYSSLVVNNLTVKGTTTTVESVTLTVSDKNIELGAVETPSDVTADGGGITLKGTTDKTILWENANDSWTANQNFNIPSGATYKINNTTVLSETQVLGVTLGTMAAADTADYVAKSLFDAHTVLYATGDNTPAALTVGEKTIVGRKSGGNIAALTPADIMSVILVSAPAAYNSAGTAGQIAFDANYGYKCVTTGAEGSALWARWPVASSW